MKAGDFFLLHERDLVSRLIQIGTHGSWNHAGLIVGDDGAIIEALAGGVACGNLSKYAGARYVVVESGLTESERAVAVAFARSCVGDRYDYADIASFGVNLMTDGHLILGQAGRYICSALVWAALREANFLRFREDPRTVSPNDLARTYGVAS